MPTMPSSENDVPLSLRGLTVTVPDGTNRRTLLDHVDLDVAPGEVIVVTGASGSGKSTLLAVTGLLRRPDSGDVVVAGISTADLSSGQRTTTRRNHIAFVFQSANLLPSLTAREQLILVGHINGEKRVASGRRADDLLEQLDMAPRASQLPAQLSGGERQRVGIARALMADPAVLLADEPTASLNPDLAVEVTDLLARETHERGLATIIVTHDAAPSRAADRRLHLSLGLLDQVTTEPVERR